MKEIIEFPVTPITEETFERQGWEKYLGDNGEAISIEKFGASAPYEVLFKEYGFTSEAIVKKAIDVIKNVKAGKVV